MMIMMMMMIMMVYDVLMRMVMMVVVVVTTMDHDDGYHGDDDGGVGDDAAVSALQSFVQRDTWSNRRHVRHLGDVHQPGHACGRSGGGTSFRAGERG